MKTHIYNLQVCVDLFLCSPAKENEQGHGEGKRIVGMPPCARSPKHVCTKASQKLWQQWGSSDACAVLGCEVMLAVMVRRVLVHRNRGFVSCLY